MRPIAPLLGLLALLAAAQPPSAAAQDSTLRVFLDCPGFAPGCDFDFFRTEIAFVNWVRNRQDADVHVLVTTQSTGAGGREYTLTFIGLKEFSGRGDTLRYNSRPAESEDQSRRGLARVLKLGLMRYVAASPLAARITISYEAPAQPVTARARDPWNYWVFRTRFNGNFNGQKSTKFKFLNGGISANRITEDWKITFGVNYGYNESKFDVPVFDSTGAETGTRRISNFQRNYGTNMLIVRSLGSHWSGGFRTSASHSTFSNLDLQLHIAPALEYDVFPYSQSTRRFLALQYTIGPTRFDYIDSTIFNQTIETLASEALTISLSTTQPWGSISASVEGAHYLHDFRKRHLTTFASFDIRLIKGLSFNMFGNAELVRDQLYLSKKNLSETDVLLQRRQLATSYRYFAFVGLSYSFGSIYNNTVNPRFGGSSGGFTFVN